VKIIHFLGKQKPWLQHYERGATEGLTFVSQYHQVTIRKNWVKNHINQESIQIVKNPTRSHLKIELGAK
jgi:lipopolysaccharide biosynthesis glycosyltransferase